MKKIANRYLIAFFCMIIPHISMASSAQIKKDNQFISQGNENTAVLLVYHTIRKNNLSGLKDQCLAYDFNDSIDANYFIVDVRENKENIICGGDPDSAVHLFRFKISKKDSSLTTDAGSADGSFHELK